MQQREQNPILHPTLTRRHGGIFLFALLILRGPTKWFTKHLSAYFHKRYRAYRQAKLLFTIDLALIGVLLILTALAGWTLYERLLRPQPLAISAASNPETITSGAPVTFTFEYENKGKTALDNVILAIGLPPNFELWRSFPTASAERTSTLPLGTLAPGSRGLAKITGRLWANVDTAAPILVTAPFTNTKNNRRQIAFEKFEFPIQDSVLETALTIPDQVYVGQPTPFIFNYENDSETELREVIIKPILPERTLIHADRAWQTDGWNIGTLAPRERGTLTGTFELDLAPSKKIEVIFQSSIIRNNETLVQDTVAVPIVTLPTPVLVTATTLLAVAKPGTELPFEVRVENASDTLLRDVAVTFAGVSPAINPTTLRSVSAGDIAPHTSKTITYSLPLRSRILFNQLEEGSPDQKLMIVVHPEASGVLASDPPVPLIIRGPEFRLPFETPFSLGASARYYSPQGDQLGRGPLPPQVNKTTKYWVTWELAPTTNEIEGVALRAKLPPNVEWTGAAHATVGRAPQFDPAARTVRWSMDHLAPTLPSGQSVVMRFEVAITPTEALRSTIPLLIEETSAQAFDTFTETTITATVPALTTALPQDDYVRGRIRVR